MTDETLLTPEQVASRLQVTPRTIYDWLRNGRLRGIKIGRLWRVRPLDLDFFLGASGAAQANESVAEADLPQEPAARLRGSATLPPEDPDVVARRNQSLIEKLNEWLADESGYDEEVWPIVKKTIEENRSSYRKRFED
jgi:excisionase family DNA binding protein